MKAILCEQWGGPETLRLADIPLPEPGPGQVRIRIAAAGVNFPDVLIIQKKYQMQPALPFVPGAEVAGTIDAVGDGVQGLAPGMAVAALCGIGGFAEACVVDAALCVPLPPGVPMDLAASLVLAWGTSWHALRDRAALREGETLLVLGAAGGVGLAAVQIGHAIGARVIAAAGTPEKLALCRTHGADEAIDYEREDLREALKRLTAGKGPDVIFDAVGGRFTEPAFRSIAWRGRHLVIGFAAGDVPALPLNLPLLKGASLVGVFWGEFAKREPKRNADGLREVLGWIGSGAIRPLVSRRYPLADAAQALADMAARRVTGKVVVMP
ncbi:MAG: NADPH:quinone oxidoreductase family protein [Xanthomonadaceae bacterium]|jgi:NADPH2:quinone reductase|nr:NADPH:quinone oxidoreductase family protein [Xanthomonadaceae bacterium]